MTGAAIGFLAGAVDRMGFRPRMDAAGLSIDFGIR